MNYTELVSTIKAYAENDFPDTAGSGGLTSTEQLDTFIRQAEERVFNSVQLLDLRKNVTGSCTSGNKYLSAPTDWLATFSIAVIDSNGRYEYLLDKDVNFIREAYPNASDTGTPVHYANFDDDAFILGPTPDASYLAELHYGYYPESIVTASTTWLGEEFDSALLNGALVEAIRFMKGEQDMVDMYNKMYVLSLGLLKNLGDGKLRGDTYRSGQPKNPVS